MKRLLLLVPLLFATPVLAQQAGQTALAPAKPSEFETVSLAIFGPCQRATATDAAAAASAEAVCAKFISDIDLVKQAAGASMTAHDTNIFHVTKAVATMRVSRAYVVMDNNTRTARVCAQAENAWSHAAKVNMAASPAEYVELMQPMVTDTAGLTRTCRIEFGTPTGAAALPQ